LFGARQGLLQARRLPRLSSSMEASSRIEPGAVAPPPEEPPEELLEPLLDEPPPDDEPPPEDDEEEEPLPLDEAQALARLFTSIEPSPVTGS
jgi:hypothetical protein